MYERSFVRFAFRCDASLEMGSGHVMRCLALAEGLRARGGWSLFICREHDGHLMATIRERGFQVSSLGRPAQVVADGAGSPYAGWLGSTWQEDAAQTRAAIETVSLAFDWLVVDHYALDWRWEAAVHPLIDRVMVIDDLADREHDCRLLLDQNLVHNMAGRYAGKLLANCVTLLGPHYALLKSEYADLHDRIPSREGPVKRILVSLGGVDIENATGKILAAFLQLRRSDVEIDVVVGASNPNVASIRGQIAGHNNIHIHSGLPTLAPLMALADLAIGACGATSWERLCLGLPALVVTLAENQVAIAKELHERHLVRWLGDLSDIQVEDIAGALGDLLGPDLEEGWSVRCSEVVDGRGLSRVCAVLTATAEEAVHIRFARVHDEQILLDWANDPVTRQNAFSEQKISALTHRAWFRARLRDYENCQLYIAETGDGIPVGQVRFQKEGASWEVHYAVAPPFRGRGLGRSMLQAALRRLCSNTSVAEVVGSVKAENLASQRIFEQLDFERSVQGAGNVILFKKCFPT